MYDPLFIFESAPAWFDFGEKEPAGWVLACFHSLKQGVLWGLASPLPSLPSLLHWSVDDWLCNSCLTRGRGVSGLRRLLLGCWHDCLPWNRSLIWGSWKQVHQPWYEHVRSGLTLFFSAWMCVVSFFSQTTREREHLSINYQKRNFLTI